MADDGLTKRRLEKRGAGNPGLNTLDSLYYDHAHER